MDRRVNVSLPEIETVGPDPGEDFRAQPNIIRRVLSNPGGLEQNQIMPLPNVNRQNLENVQNLGDGVQNLVIDPQIRENAAMANPANATVGGIHVDNLVDRLCNGKYSGCKMT